MPTHARTVAVRASRFTQLLWTTCCTGFLAREFQQRALLGCVVPGFASGVVVRWKPKSLQARLAFAFFLLAGTPSWRRSRRSLGLVWRWWPLEGAVATALLEASCSTMRPEGRQKAFLEAGVQALSGGPKFYDQDHRGPGTTAPRGEKRELNAAVSPISRSSPPFPRSWTPKTLTQC